MIISFELNEHEEEITPIKVAEALIESKRNYESIFSNKIMETERFEVFELEEIAGHLLVYCKSKRKEVSNE